MTPRSRVVAVLACLAVLLSLSLPALADATVYTNPSTYGRATYDTSENKFTVWDEECDGNTMYVNYGFNSNGSSPPASYSTHHAGIGCGQSESWFVSPSSSMVVFRVCVYNTLGPDYCSGWVSTNA